MFTNIFILESKQHSTDLVFEIERLILIERLIRFESVQNLERFLNWIEIVLSCTSTETFWLVTFWSHRSTCTEHGTVHTWHTWNTKTWWTADILWLNISLRHDWRIWAWFQWIWIVNWFFDVRGKLFSLDVSVVCGVTSHFMYYAKRI